MDKFDRTDIVIASLIVGYAIGSLVTQRRTLTLLKLAKMASDIEK